MFMSTPEQVGTNRPPTPNRGVLATRPHTSFQLATDLAASDFSEPHIYRVAAPCGRPDEVRPW